MSILHISAAMVTYSHSLKRFRHVRWALFAPMSALCLASCGKPSLSLSDVPGIWQSNGYGWYIAIKDGKAGQVYHVNDGVCLQIKDDEIGETIAGLSLIAGETALSKLNQ